jgi:predicted nucleic acid-binding protein
MDRVFLDANVLFSAAYRQQAGLSRLWELANAVLVTSSYALEEARRNLDRAAQDRRLALLMAQVELVAEASDSPITLSVDLPGDDRPILRAAVASRCTHLLTGDRRAFGPFYGVRIEGVLILRPAEYLGLGDPARE